MTRAAHPPQLVRDAIAMRDNGYTYEEIARALSCPSRTIGASTVRDWVTYYSRDEELRRRA